MTEKRIEISDDGLVLKVTARAFGSVVPITEVYKLRVSWDIRSVITSTPVSYIPHTDIKPYDIAGK